jgi:hypothetical protein
VTLQEFAHGRFRQRAHEAVDHLAVLDQHDSRQAAHAECRGQLHLRIRVDLGQPDRAVVAGHDLFEDRRQGFARPAPCRPEVHEHGRGQRCLDDLGLEVEFGSVENVR